MILRILDIRSTGGDAHDALPCVSHKNRNEVDTENTDIIENEDNDVSDERRRVRGLQTRERSEVGIMLKVKNRKLQLLEF